MMVFAHIEKERKTGEAFFDMPKVTRREGEIFNILHHIPKGRFRISNLLLANVYF